MNFGRKYLIFSGKCLEWESEMSFVVQLFLARPLHILPNKLIDMKTASLLNKGAANIVS